MSRSLSTPALPTSGTPRAFRELAYWLYRYRRTWRGTVVISVANPLLFLTGIGAGLGTLVNHNNSAYLHGLSYLSFLAPGLLAATAMQTAYVDASMAVHQSVRTRGNYRAAAATPMSPADIYHGHLLFNVLKGALSSVAFTAVAVAFGAVDVARAPLLVLAGVLVSLAFCAPIAAWAVTVDRSSKILGLLRFGIMPLFMFSGTFFPIAQLPGWLQVAAEVTPLWHAIELCRTVALGTATASGAAVHIGYLALMAAAGVAAGRRTHRRHLHS